MRLFPKIANLLDILLEINYISNYRVNGRSVIIFLLYPSLRPAWSGVKIYNKPSRPIKVNSVGVRKVFKYNRSYVAIVSSRVGLITTNDMIYKNMSGRLLYLFF